jgi:hypothetical protein
MAQPDGSQPAVPDQMSINDAVMIQDLEDGARVRLRGGGTAEVTANPHDGQWVYVRFLEYPRDPSRVGEEDLVFCTDVVGIL